MVIFRSPRAGKGREEAGGPRIRELAGKMAEEIEPGEDDQHGEAEEAVAIVSNMTFRFTAVCIGSLGRRCARPTRLTHPRNRLYTGVSNIIQNLNTLLN